jgi:hypothetical protein
MRREELAILRFDPSSRAVLTYRGAAGCRIEATHL